MHIQCDDRGISSMVSLASFHTDNRSRRIIPRAPWKKTHQRAILLEDLSAALELMSALGIVGTAKNANKSVSVSGGGGSE